MTEDVAGDVVMTDDDKLPADGRDSGIGQSAASSSIPSIVIDHLSSGVPSRVQSGLANQGADFLTSTIGSKSWEPRGPWPP